MSINCPTCGNPLTPTQKKQKAQRYLITHTHNHVQHIDEAIVHSDAFYEVISGNRKGGLVHRWSASNVSAH